MNAVGKIVAINGRFENIKAFLHHIAENEEAVGFVGCVWLKNGDPVPVEFEITRQQMALAAAMWLQECVRGADAGESGAVA